jgi:hypothetical protein
MRLDARDAEDYPCAMTDDADLAHLLTRLDGLEAKFDQVVEALAAFQRQAEHVEALMREWRQLYGEDRPPPERPLQ